MRVFHFGTLKDGGEFYVNADCINKWQSLYPNIDVVTFINNLNTDGAFNKLSRKSALKLINKSLEEKEASIS